MLFERIGDMAKLLSKNHGYITVTAARVSGVCKPCQKPFMVELR